MNKNHELQPMAGRFNIYSRPDKPATFTTQQAAEALNVSRSCITNIVNRYDLPRTKDHKQHGAPSVFDYVKVKKIAEILKNQKHRQPGKTKVNTPDMDAEAAKHPLVTNPLFLKISYFPDVTPECFKSEDD